MIKDNPLQHPTFDLRSADGLPPCKEPWLYHPCMPKPQPTPLILSTALMLSACVNPAGVTPKAQVLDPARLGLETSVASAAPSEQAWWRAWGDAQLDDLVATALADHPNLRVLQARVQRAEAAAQTVQSQDGPQVQAAADATRQKFSRNFIYPPQIGRAHV